MKHSVLEQLLVVRVEAVVVQPHTVALVVLAVGAVTRVDQEEGGALGNVQVGVVLVREVGLKRPHSSTLVTVADTDQLVRVAPASGCESHNLAELGELCSDLAEGPDVQIQKGDAERWRT